jgi:hypothetical protein
MLPITTVREMVRGLGTLTGAEAATHLLEMESLNTILKSLMGR